SPICRLRCRNRATGPCAPRPVTQRFARRYRAISHRRWRRNRATHQFRNDRPRPPSPASPRNAIRGSAPLAHRRCATRQAHARVRREGAVRERGDPARRDGWVRVAPLSVMKLLRSARVWRGAAPLAVGALLLALWEAAVRFEGIPPYIL